MNGVTDLEVGGTVERPCIDCGEPVMVDLERDDPDAARCVDCRINALPPELVRQAANAYGRGLLAALDAKAAALKSDAA